MILLFTFHSNFDGANASKLKSDKLCSQCSICQPKQCPASEAYPHMTAFDNTLIAGALQSDFVDSDDRGVYSVADIKGSESEEYNAYFGWKSTSGSASHSGQKEKVRLRSLSSLESLAEADGKSINPPKKLNHQEVRFWVSRMTGKCLTVFSGKKYKKVGVAECKFDGSNVKQLFAFRFHYHKAFCCCGVHNY